MNPKIQKSKNPLIHQSEYAARGAATLALALTCGLVALSQVALPLKAQDLYIGSYGTWAVNEYTLSGVIIRTNLVSAPDATFDAISGNDLFVVTGGAIGEYTLLGQTNNASLISGFISPGGIAVSGTNLFVANYSNANGGTVGKYTTSGQTINASLISGLSEPEGIAISGTNLFVADEGSGTIGEYTTSGATVNASLISELVFPYGIAISGTNLFISNIEYNSIGEYTTSGATVNASLITGLNLPYGIAIYGTNLYVANFGTGTIGEYTTSGAKINASLISFYDPWGIAIGPPPQLNITTAGNQSFITYPYSTFGTNYILQSSTNLALTNWVTVTNGVPIIGVMVTNNSPATFFRVVLAPGQ